MMRGEGQEGIVLPVVVDTLPGRGMRASYIEKKTYKSFRTNKRPHLLSSTHIDNMRKLPY